MITIQEQVPLAQYTTFEIGGPARYFVDVPSEEELREALDWATERAVRTVLLAGGSNVLISDAGVNGLVIKISLGEIEFTDTSKWIGAGNNLLRVVRDAAKAEIGGWEKLAGIPGTVGGAVRGNAGAFGSEIKDFVTEVTALNMQTRASKTFSTAECDFSYRHSYFKDNPEWIILAARFENLAPVSLSDSIALIDDTISERERRHIQNVRAAGSYFMNPVAPPEVQRQFELEKNTTSREGRVPAGWLIEKVGMKGARVGGAIASLQHPNYLVNDSQASSDDVIALARQIADKIRAEFNISIQEEAALLS